MNQNTPQMAIKLFYVSSMVLQSEDSVVICVRERVKPSDDLPNQDLSQYRRTVYL